MRYEAIQCIHVLLQLIQYTQSHSHSHGMSLSLSLLTPYKAVVVKNMRKCLDDRKRGVRACAAQLLNKWILILDTPV